MPQPRFVGIHDPADYPDAQPLAPLGTVLLGKETAFERLLFSAPEPAQLGLLGSFSAFRVLAQDVAGFEAYLDNAAMDPTVTVPLGDFDYDAAQPNDGIERGLLGHFLCANLAAQFEAIYYDWLNLGLQDARITGSNDPLLGANDPLDSWFDMPVKSGVIRLRGLPRFVTTRGGAYLFLPSLPALRYLSAP